MDSHSSEEDIYEDASPISGTSTMTMKNPNNDEIIENLIKEQTEMKINDEIESASSSKNLDNDKDVEEVPSSITDEDSLRDYEKTLTVEQLASNKEKADDLKKIGNDQFKNEEYEKSIETYDEAIKICPFSCPNERSILYGNRGAANIQLNAKQAAIEDCTKAIELNPKYMKVFIRRAKLYEETDKLDESLEDYKKCVEIDPSYVEGRVAIARLQPLIDERNEKLKAEMLGKLKDLGNMILKPFGLSTNNFQMKQDPATGSYSVNFNQ